MNVMNATRTSRLRLIVAWAAAALFVRVLFGILWEYQWYFPADFEASAFLTGRRQTFVGIYRWAFYAHIISGPLVLIFGTVLMLSGGRSRFFRAHRYLGRLQMLLVLGVLTPTGLVMSREALTGPIAGFGFAALSMATAVCACAAAFNARARKFHAHQRWATRLLILLVSPLLLRIVSGVLIVTEFEPDWAYRLNTWLSWLVPWGIYEMLLPRRTNGDMIQIVRNDSGTSRGLSR